MKYMVLFCKNKQKIPGITYFSLTSGRHDSWMRALGRDPTVEHLCRQNSVCSEHFLQEDTLIIKNKLRLKAGAVPRLKLGIKRSFQPTYQHNRDEERISKQMPLSSTQEENKENILCTIVTSPTRILELPKRISKQMPSSSTQEEAKDMSCTILTSSPSYILESPKSTNTKVKRKLDKNTSSSDSEGYKGEVKKSRKNVKLYHNYSASSRNILKELTEVKATKTYIQKKLSSSTRKIRELKKRVSSLKKIVWDLKNKHLVSDNALTMLQKTCSGIPFTLMKRAIANIKKSKAGKKQGREKIPEEIRSFALTLQFYSSKAYNYVRKTFNLALPSPSTIRSWLSNIECKPGFCECSFISIKRIVLENEKEHKKTICSLMLDEMAIKKQIEVRANTTWGYEDCGTGIKDDSLKCATEALVLMVVSVNSNWKIPIAYFLINSLTGAEKANIVKESIKKLHEIGVIITSVTCDGPSAHFAMAERLGAYIKYMDNLKPYFNHPLNNSKVYIVFDACHMLKLVRNNWDTCKMFVDENGNKIDFNFIKKLHDIQQSEFCQLGTKLRKSHIEWQKQKMKVNLAAQTISASVADAVEFLMQDIQHPDFLGAEATIKFIRVIDRLFDLLNSRNPFGRGYKTPMKRVNENYWRPFLEESFKYLSLLRNPDGQLLYTTRNKTPIKGFCITIKSLIGIYDEYVKNEASPLDYLLTYKFSQDHLELFFCCIRGKNGWNNNPTAYQFYCTFKRLALRHDIKNLKGNCLALDNTNILMTTQHPKKVYPGISLDDISIIKKYNIDVNDLIIEDDDFHKIIFLPDLSVLTENVVTYISGFVVKTIKKYIKCPTCCLSLEEIYRSAVDDCHFQLINRKNRGGLIKASTSMFFR